MIQEEEISFDKTLNYEADRAEFNRIRKLYFDSFNYSNKSTAEKIIEMKQFFSYSDSPWNSEQFIDEKDVPLLWVWDNPFILTFENEFKEKLSLFRVKHIDLKKHFSKIFLEENKSKSEINYKLFVSLTKSFFGINHILIPLFKALVLMYNKSSINYNFALRELNEAENMLVYLDPSKNSKKIYTYFVNLYKSLVYIQLNNYDEAIEKLDNALKVNPNGINAYFTMCRLYADLNQVNKVEEAIHKIVNIDLERIKSAINRENLDHFYYSLQNPSLPYIFNINSLAVYNKIINKVLSFHFDKNITFDNIELRINYINEINLIEYINENNVSKMLFLNHIFSDKNNLNSVYFRLIIPLIEEIFLNIVENLKKNIKDKFYGELYAKLNEFDRRINEYQQKKNEINDDLVKSKEQADKKMQESIKIFDESITNAISESEQMLSNVDLIAKFNPIEALQNSMIYNFITSIFVFSIVILGNYFKLDSDTSSNASSLLSYLIISGIKWAAITFLIGVLISLVYSIFVFFEKINFQQNLKKKISQLKKEKDININLIRKDYIKKNATLTEESNSKIEAIDRRIEELKKEKIENENSLRARAEINMQPIMEKINYAIKPNISLENNLD